MSFPTKYLSSSPTVQRDYALLGNRLRRPTIESEPVLEENEEENREGSQAAGAQRGSQNDKDRRRESINQSESGEETVDNDAMSNLSLPDSSDDTYPVSKDNDNVRSSGKPNAHYVKSPHLGAADHSRGNISANLHQQIVTSPLFGPRHRTSTTNGGRAINVDNQALEGQDKGLQQAVGSFASSFVLGGQHFLPPADADMRSQAELDYASSSSFSNLAPDEEDLTPMPGPRTGQWFGTQSQRQNENENSPLLSQSIAATSSAYGSVSGIPDGIRRPRQPSWQMSSGWDLRQPAPPDQEQLEEIAHESDQHIHRREIAILVKFSIPIWLCHLLELSLNVASVFSLGHLGTNELAAASLSSMTANVTGFSILAGFISALDSILPGAYTSQPKMVGLYTQRMLVIVAYLLVPICGIWLSAEKILLLLGQDPVVAKLAADYLRILVIGLPGYAGFEVCRRYLQAQGLMHAPTVVLFVASPVNAILNWLFVWGPSQFRFGFIGAPLASVISMWLMFILGGLQCYIAPRIAWDGWSKLAFSGLKPIVQLGTAGTFAMCAEWWSWEIVGLVTSKLGTISLAAQSVVLVCSSISYQLPYAMSIAAAVRVGNLLGASQAKNAKISSDMSMFLSLIAGVMNSTMFMFIRNNLGGLFSEDEEVIELVAQIIPIMATFQIFDGICGLAAGILRGTGRQSKGAIINLTGYYAIGIPIGLFLTFGPPRWGLSGLWWGLTIALIYASIASLFIIQRTDWDEEVRKTLARMSVDETSGGQKQQSQPETNNGYQALPRVSVEAGSVA